MFFRSFFVTSHQLLKEWPVWPKGYAENIDTETCEEDKKGQLVLFFIEKQIYIRCRSHLLFLSPSFFQFVLGANFCLH